MPRSRERIAIPAPAPKTHLPYRPASATSQLDQDMSFTSELNPQQRGILQMQQTHGNFAVQRMLSRQPSHAANSAAGGHIPASTQFARPVIQRWKNDVSARPLVDAIKQASADDIRAIMPSLDISQIYTSEVIVRLPDSRIFVIDADDAQPMLDLAQNRLIERLMEDLAAARASKVDAMNKATDDAARRKAMLALRAVDQPLLDQLRPLTAKRKNRWEHPKTTVQDAVLAAIQLEAALYSESDLDRSKEAEKEALQTCDADAGSEWCGFFSVKNFIKSNLDKDLRNGFFHTDNVEDYFNYRYERYSTRIPKWIYADDAWSELQDYHATRGAQRKWIDARAIYSGDELDIRSGDIVLIDRGDSADGRPVYLGDHIVMVHSYDPNTRRLFTVGGNDSGYEVDNSATHPAPAGESTAERNKRQSAEAATGRKLKPGSAGGHVGVNVQDLSNQPDPAVIEAHPGTARVRVYGIGRPSLVDFEEHFYQNMDEKHPNTVPIKKPK